MLRVLLAFFSVALSVGNLSASVSCLAVIRELEKRTWDEAEAYNSAMARYQEATRSGIGIEEASTNLLQAKEALDESRQQRHEETNILLLKRDLAASAGMGYMEKRNLPTMGLDLAKKAELVKSAEDYAASLKPGEADAAEIELAGKLVTFANELLPQSDRPSAFADIGYDGPKPGLSLDRGGRPVIGKKKKKKR